MGLLTTLCLLGILISSSFWAAKAQSCAGDWMMIQNNCYAYFDQKLSWAEAEIDCQSYGRGVHLTSILTMEETDLLSLHIKDYQKDYSNVWIGLSDIRRNGKWRWADSSVYNYKAWMANKPNNFYNSGYCVELMSNSDFKGWNNAPCKQLNAYICKRAL